MRGYDRTDRLNELLIRILAEELEIIDDEVLGFVTITGVQTDKSLTQAKVFVTGDLDDEELCNRLEIHRSRLQRAINIRQDCVECHLSLSLLMIRLNLPKELKICFVN